MVPRVACLAYPQSKSFGFPENPPEGADPALSHVRSDATHWTVQEREAAKTLFLTADGLPTQLATTLSTTVSTHAKATVTIDEPKPVVAPGKAGRLMSKEEAQRVKEAIAKATSIEEIRRLERSLREGFMPNMDSVGA